MIKISVSASKKYDVIMKTGSLSEVSDLLTAIGVSASDKICIITDEKVNSIYGGEHDPLWQNLKAAGFDLYKYVFAGGEKNKTLDTIGSILNFLADNRFSRNDKLIALGGGIVGDVTGFAAATYLRGIEYVQIPTTLLATVDSSVGGKTGVNLNAGKNLAGAFWQPSMVIFDPRVLDTLPYHTLLDGIAEAVKAGLINDKTIIDDINTMLSACVDSSVLSDKLSENHDFLASLAAKAVEVKRQVVEEDERDTASRQLLNFGHTIAHAIEKCSDYKISHGHAVAIGMVIVSAAADKFNWTNEPCAKIIRDLLIRFGFCLECPYSAKELTVAALQDKKIRGDEITLVIPEILGICRLKSISTARLEEFIDCGIEESKRL